MMSEFSKNLRRMRAERGISQAQLAELSGLHINTISRWERDERVPKTHDLEKVAMALDTTTAAILGNAVYDAPSGHRFRLTPYAVLFDSVCRKSHLMGQTERQQAFDIVEKAAEILWKAWASHLHDGEITNLVISSAKKRWKTAAPKQHDRDDHFVATLTPYSEIYDMACDDSAVATFDDLNLALDILCDILGELSRPQDLKLPTPDSDTVL